MTARVELRIFQNTEVITSYRIVLTEGEEAFELPKDPNQIDFKAHVFDPERIDWEDQLEGVEILSGGTAVNDEVILDGGDSDTVYTLPPILVDQGA